MIPSRLCGSITTRIVVNRDYGARNCLRPVSMAYLNTSASSDPIQKLFVDKIKEFKSNNQGLDEAHKKAMNEEMGRLKRVYQIEDESKLTKLEHKFPNEVNVSLHDLDEKKDFYVQIASGEYQKQLAAKPEPPSALMATIPEQVIEDMHLPPGNKPDIATLLTNQGIPQAPKLGQPEPDYNHNGELVTPHKLERMLLVKFNPDMPTIHDDKNPERDLVNFPTQPQKLDTPPTRYHFIPESWFRFFYPKTGVTGPYVFAATLSTFLYSKEWLIMEHEMLTAFSTTIIFSYAIVKYGPKVSAYIRKGVKQEYDDWENWRKGNISLLEELQEKYKEQLTKRPLLDEIYEIRRQDIDNQVNLEYRLRLKKVYDDTKRRLDYLVSVADSKRQIAHRNMVNWVITNSIASFGTKQEEQVFNSCISNLKELASKNSNVI